MRLDFTKVLQNGFVSKIFIKFREQNYAVKHTKRNIDAVPRSVHPAHVFEPA